MLIDTLAERYGKLPSQIIRDADTFDLFIMDAALSYRQYVQRKSEGKVAEDYTVEELQAMIQKVRK
jgi:hypothetical protein